MALWDYRAEVINVVDGDTIDVRVDLGFYTWTEVRVRLIGVDTAEIYGPNAEELGQEHKQFVEDWLKSTDELILSTEKDEKGKYGRWLGDFKNGEHEHLTHALVNEYGDSVKY